MASATSASRLWLSTVSSRRRMPSSEEKRSLSCSESIVTWIWAIVGFRLGDDCLATTLLKRTAMAFAATGPFTAKIGTQSLGAPPQRSRACLRRLPVRCQRALFDRRSHRQRGAAVEPHHEPYRQADERSGAPTRLARRDGGGRARGADHGVS